MYLILTTETLVGLGLFRPSFVGLAVAGAASIAAELLSVCICYVCVFMCVFSDTERHEFIYCTAVDFFYPTNRTLWEIVKRCLDNVQHYIASEY